MRTLILASASPQRRTILADAGFEFEVRPADVDEETEGDPAAVAERNARRKATAIRPHPPQLVLGADTVVALDGRIYGKPADEAQAREYLAALNGRTHEVVGAIALAERGAVVATAVETTKVTFRRRPDDEIAAYVATGEWMGRAGGYAIQEEGGSFIVEGIEGDYLNVVGLPLERLKVLLATR
jgi:septum formation protein